MKTPDFWRAVDRLGTRGSALLNWRAVLKGLFESATPALRPLATVADYICDPDDLSKRLAIYPCGEDGYIAESELCPPHREAIKIPAADVRLHSIDWLALPAVLASALGFISLPHPEGAGQIRRIGFVQRKTEIVQVHLFLPAGSIFDAVGFVCELAALSDVILYVPTGRWLSAEVVSVAERHRISFRILDDTFGFTEAERGSLHADSYVPTPRSPSSQLKSILTVQPDWRWEDLTVKLTDNGTLLASYGRHRGRHRFEKRGSGISKSFATLARLAWQGEWTNPRSGSAEHERLRKRFNRLRETLTDLIPIPGDPFHCEAGVWRPVFKLEMEADLQAILTQHAPNDGPAGEEDDRDFE